MDLQFSKLPFGRKGFSLHALQRPRGRTTLPQVTPLPCAALSEWHGFWPAQARPASRETASTTGTKNFMLEGGER